eukprot:3869469-Prymnesium_polylepis.2
MDLAEMAGLIQALIDRVENIENFLCAMIERDLDCDRCHTAMCKGCAPRDEDPTIPYSRSPSTGL